MLKILNYNKCNVIGINYKKIKINNLFLNSDFILFINLNNYFYLKNKILQYNLYSVILNTKFIKTLFNIPQFLFFRNNNILCIFINDIEMFINFIKIVENKQCFYSYKNYLSNIIINSKILEEYNKYNMNFIYIQFILKLLKIKIIILLFLFLISIIKYVN
jgi:hypothetical protein